MSTNDDVVLGFKPVHEDPDQHDALIYENQPHRKAPVHEEETMSIRVLIVTDAEGSFGNPRQNRFALTELVAALKEDGITVTTAHRSLANEVAFGKYAATAALPGFKFTDGLPYDTVWLIGFASTSPPYNAPSHAPSPPELVALARFMSGGGGVFATGDHDDMGADLCAAVLRVGTMRQWTPDFTYHQEGLLASSDPASFTKPKPMTSPPPFGPYRLDTTRRGHDAHYEFQDQSDDVPQIIKPATKSYFKIVDGKTVFYPVAHPLLTVPGTTRIITVMPDHMHEGRCQLPLDPAGKYHLGDHLMDEYPLDADGVRILPEIVARNVVTARKREPNFNEYDAPVAIKDGNAEVNGEVFPSIVAYHGQAAGVGNVVVDSTFHHFVNINVSGVKTAFPTDKNPNPNDPTKCNGFLSSAVGKAHYALIKTYWCNIARWTARPGAG